VLSDGASDVVGTRGHISHEKWIDIGKCQALSAEVNSTQKQFLLNCAA